MHQLPAPRTTSTTVKEVYELDDLDLERVAAHGAKAVTRELEDRLGDIRMLGRLKTGLVTVQDIGRLFGVSERTVHNWPLEPADTDTQRNFYRVEDLGEQLTRD